MEKLTKKEFNGLHKGGDLELLASISKSKEVVMDMINEHLKTNNTIDGKEVSSVDVASQGDYVKTGIYKEDIYIFVESVIDNSKCRTCSWNNMEVNTIAYKIKG